MLPQSGILNMFARSPMRPLQKHMEQAFQCAKLLNPFFDAVIAGNWDNATEVRERLTAIEQKADELKMDFRIHLPRGLFLPVHRSDLLALLSKQRTYRKCFQGYFRHHARSQNADSI